MKSSKFTYTLIIAIIGTLLTSTALAASPAVIQVPPPPTPKFFTKARIISLSIGAAMMTADILTTRQALHVPGAHEANPMGQSAESRYALKFAGMGAGIGISYALHRSGHYKAARIVPMIIGLPSAVAAIHNAGIHK
jgi:hypothetical protein